MSTYSINVGEITEAYKLSNVNDVLSEMPDNIEKIITPHNLRDAVYTVYENISFKPTTNNAAIEYIGIDQNFIHEKIFLGKKQISGTDILSTLLLNSDVDLFLYNTKTDSNLSAQNFKMALFAGASTSLFNYDNTNLTTPYIESKIVTNSNGNIINLDIINASYNKSILGVTAGANISILSNYGNVLVNGLVFPTYAQNLSATNSYVIKINNVGGVPYLYWDSINADNITSITSAGTVSITGHPLLINGTDIMFSDAQPTPVQVGSIAAGSTFSNVAITDILRQILYPYIAPIVSVSSATTYLEVSSITQSLNLNYSITKVVASSSIIGISTTPLFITDTVTPITYLNSLSTINTVYTASNTYTSSTYFNTIGSDSFNLIVTDDIGSPISVTYSVTTVYPLFYGTSLTFSATQSVVQSLLPNFSKVLTDLSTITVPYQGTNSCVYMCIPSVYNISGSMSYVFDSNSPTVNIKNIFKGTGMPFTMSLYSPDSMWASTVYNCYIYSPSGTPGVTAIGLPPLYTANYEFHY